MEKLTVKKILGRAASGIAYGCTWLVVVGIILDRFGIAIGVSDPNGIYTASFIEQALFAMLVGAAFVLPTLIYENERLSTAVKVVVHMAIGFGFFIPVGIRLHWFPAGDISAGQAAVWVLVIAAVSFVVWMCFFLYYRRESLAINQKLKEI